MVRKRAAESSGLSFVVLTEEVERCSLVHLCGPPGRDEMTGGGHPNSTHGATVAKQKP